MYIEKLLLMPEGVGDVMRHMFNRERANAPGDRPHAPHAPNDRRRLHGSIAHKIGVGIVGGQYAPGEILPNEDDFSEKLDVSRTAYREAIRILAAKGLVESRPKIGTRIRPRTDWNFLDADVLAWLLAAEASPSFVAALYEVRDMVEPRAAELAAQRRTATDLANMTSALAVMRRERLSNVAGQQADLDFHHAILLAAHNEPLVSMSPAIGMTIQWSNQFKGARGQLDQDAFQEHWDVYEAIEKQDGPRAREAMAALIARAQPDTVG